MPITVEYRALHRAIDDLRDAVTSLRAVHGEVVAVARLQNDLDRLVLDVADADALAAPARPVGQPADPRPSATRGGSEPAEISPWGDDIDDEGIGGIRGYRR